MAALAALCLPGAGAAAPRVTLKAIPLPIQGAGGKVRGTGYMYGAGVALRAEYGIAGTEYGGFPPPLVAISFYLPKGSLIHSPKAASLTCNPAVIEAHLGTEACPKGSKAGPVGHASGVVAFGRTRVEEETTIEPFFAPNGGLEFWTEGSSPTQLHFLSKGRYTAAGGEFGQKFEGAVPLVETVQGAPDASVLRIQVTVGVAFREHGRTIYYGTLPKKGECPHAGFTVRSDLTFEAEPSFSLPRQTVTVSYKAPCPRR